MKESFISKSANPEYIRQKNLQRATQPVPMVIEKVKALQKDSIIFYIGNFNEDFLSYGRDIGFTLIKYDLQDPSILLSGRYLILSDLDMDLRKRIETINIAACYGLQIIWHSRKSIPHRFMWRFQLCVVGDIDVKEFWREVWNMSL